MRTKEKDVPYCGVRQNKIKKAVPIVDENYFDLFMSFLKERYKIHVKKDVMFEEPPWTEDSVLRYYKFTNIRREHDRETKWLIKNIADNSWLSYRQKLLNIILFRMFNKHETLEIIGAPFKFEGVWECKTIVGRFKLYLENNKDFIPFSNAFLASGMKRILKQEFPKHKSFVPGLPIWKMKQLNESEFFTNLKFCKNQNEVYQLLRNINAIGDFLAYQIFVDFTYIKNFPFSENEFTIAGIGCKRGLDYLFLDKDGMSYEECIFWLRDNWKNFKKRDGVFFDPEKEMIDLKHYDRVMNVMSLENCFCEFGKYVKTLNKEGRPRSKYKPRKDD